jgi:hypothetical protein
MIETIKSIGYEYHDFANFLETLKVLEKINKKDVKAVILLNEKMMEKKINMLEDNIQVLTLRKHIILNKSKLEKYPIQFLINIDSIDFYTIQEPIVYHPPFWKKLLTWLN